MTDLPELGAVIRLEWALDPDYVTVNHGSYGATPRCVLAAQREWQDQLERQPTRFMTVELPSLLRAAAETFAAFVGAEGRDLVFAENATQACNAVLRSLTFAADDEILVLSHGYGAVVKAVRYIASRSGARMIVAELPFPRPDDDSIIANLQAAITPRTKLAVLDHITSASALVLPIQRMVAACHAHGVRVLVDGAHAPGHVPLDVTEINADWYTGNAHKWLMAPKGCAFLWARRDRQHDLHPVTISHGYGDGYLAEFDWIGTRDPSAWLSVTASLDFYHRLGGAALQARNIALAAEAAARLAARFGTETGTGNATQGAMGLVRLPIPGVITAEHTLALRTRLLEAGTDAPIHPLAGGAWLRISAQAYNEMADFDAMADLVAKLL
jgi:isopenicillin-N epimerase